MAYQSDIINAIFDSLNNAIRVVQAFRFRYINSATTTVVKSGSGLLHTIVNSDLATGSTITIYDGTDANGVVIGVIDNTHIVNTFTYDVAFTTGLTIVTAGSGGIQVTVSYR